MKGYCFDCKREIKVALLTEPCPFCGSDYWCPDERDIIAIERGENDR